MLRFDSMEELLTKADPEQEKNKLLMVQISFGVLISFRLKTWVW